MDSRSQHEDLLDQFEELATFSNDETLQLGEFASLAYLDRDANLGVASYTTVSPFATDLSSGFVRARGAEVVVTYKGTDTARDFQTDFDAWPLARPELLPEGRIHGGFLKAWESTWPQVAAILDSHAHDHGLQVSDLQVTVCGHSLGAAQATLAALQVARHLVRSVDQVRLPTFGSPRVFTWAGAAFFERMGLGARTLVWRRTTPTR
ncbi:lipase [Acanthamoeba castellanii str. Neff]|uniref:Lipase n=1 Tax=Acanthamoeba castellanii (strain ATCC 30010 / Neff) TaxID=1257118 RepID=L8GM53_ACACF|nr:lipase [Acanthamoeba castellanii str. Neff]ELR14067.1 lipase [Acanthamoeba castellanii str. Neff]